MKEDHNFQGRILRDATLICMDKAARVIPADLRIYAGRIVAIAEKVEAEPQDEIIDLSGHVLMPGFVQGHIHLVQTLFRGAAENKALLPWLTERIWPFEMAHTAESVSASAQLGLAEMLLSGTTAALDMGTVHHTEAIFETAAKMGFRLTSGKSMSDQGDGSPEGFIEDTASCVQRAVDLAHKWHGAHEGLLHYAFAPRFVLSSSEKLMRQSMDAAQNLGCLFHTHASENPEEVAFIKSHFGMGNVALLHKMGLLAANTVLAHCVHLDDHDVELLARSGAHVSHCPSTNLKLASGIADTVRLKKAGINIAIGADGAACNNRLDQFSEMRLAALLQKPLHGASALSSQEALYMATMGGAKALGLESEIGSIEVGKKADLIAIDMQKAHLQPVHDPRDAIVYSAHASDVRHVFVQGEWRVKDGMLVGHNLADILHHAHTAMKDLMLRAAA